MENQNKENAARNAPKADISQNQNLKKQFLPNLLSNGSIFVLNIILGMWYTPYLIRHLGLAVYGLVPLANSLTSYLSLINLSLNGAAGRFLTIDLEKGDTKSANANFNTVLLGNLGLVVLTLPVLVILVLNLQRWFDIPLGHEAGAKWLFAATLAAYLLNMIRSSFSVSSWARNRFDLRNLVIAIHHLSRVGIVVSIFMLTHPKLWHVGAGIIGAVCIGFVGDTIIWRKLTPQLHIQPRSFDHKRIRELFGMGGWMVINQIGSLLFLNIDLILANTQLGAEIAGGYGSVILFSTMLRQLSETIATVLTPTILAKYAHGDLNAVNRISKQAVKFMGLGMALPIGLVCGFAAPILALWLGPEFKNLSGLLILLTAHLSINLTIKPLFGINVAFNKVRIPGIVTLIMGITNVGLALLFLHLGWGALGIAASGAIVLTLKNTFFTPIYAAHIQKLPWWTFFPEIFPALASFVSIAGISYRMSQIISIDSLLVLTLSGILIAVLYAAIVYFLILRAEDHKLLRGLIPARVLKK